MGVNVSDSPPAIRLRATRTSIMCTSCTGSTCTSGGVGVGVAVNQPRSMMRALWQHHEWNNCLCQTYSTRSWQGTLSSPKEGPGCKREAYGACFMNTYQNG
eukprot:1158706-Pelagomonas_calceolata.AAC.6